MVEVVGVIWCVRRVDGVMVIVWWESSRRSGGIKMSNKLYVIYTSHISMTIQ